MKLCLLSVLSYLLEPYKQTTQDIDAVICRMSLNQLSISLFQSVRNNTNRGGYFFFG